MKGWIEMTASLVWLWRVDAVPPDRWDLLGALVALAGMAIIAFAPRAG